MFDLAAFGPSSVSGGPRESRLSMRDLAYSRGCAEDPGHDRYGWRVRLGLPIKPQLW
jgi:hypothetical protein